MAKESFEDEEVIRILNKNFISVKLDRDERPDVDRRYQQAAAAMGSGGGWPLSVFLTPDRRPFFGGTYFPPEDTRVRPGFKKVLRSVLEFYKTHRDEISVYADRLIHTLAPEPTVEEKLNESALDGALSSVLAEFDPQNGGFGLSGHGPKFPLSGAIEFLLERYALTGNEAARLAAKKTLTSMAKGGFHDQLGGGFHRYSTDGAWIVPHFEKMADDNSWLLKNYTDAYSLLGDEYFREVAEGIISFIKEVLSEPEGGFYASQDADVTPDDEGGYFTWTEDELKAALDEDEFGAISIHLFHEAGSMHHNPSKRVLFVSEEIKDVAEKLGLDEPSARELIKNATGKLLEARRKRQMPFVDRALYTSLNGMLSAAYLKAYGVLKDDYLRDFALKTIEKIIGMNYRDGALYHSGNVKAMIEDYVYLVEALISAYEATGEAAYLSRGQGLMDDCVKKFWDDRDSGFFDSEGEVLGIRLKAVEDIPHPSANSVAALLLIKLHYITGHQRYMELAEKTLGVFAERAREMGLHASYYYCALNACFDMIILTTGSPELARTASSVTLPYSTIIYRKGDGTATPCFRQRCYEPIGSAGALEKFLREPLR